MQESVKRAITALIQEAKTKLHQSSLSSGWSKYSAEIQDALRDELRGEIDKLTIMLHDTVTFESRLKERCSKRSHDYKKSVPLRYLHDSPANKLYWDLVVAVFNPNSMQEIFAIMLPDVKYQVELQASGDEINLEKKPLHLTMAAHYADA